MQDADMRPSVLDLLNRSVLREQIYALLKEEELQRGDVQHEDEQRGDVHPRAKHGGRSSSSSAGPGRASSPAKGSEKVVCRPQEREKRPAPVCEAGNQKPRKSIEDRVGLMRDRAGERKDRYGVPRPGAVEGWLNEPSKLGEASKHEARVPPVQKVQQPKASSLVPARAGEDRDSFVPCSKKAVPSKGPPKPALGHREIASAVGQPGANPPPKKNLFLQKVVVDLSSDDARAKERQAEADFILKQHGFAQRGKAKGGPGAPPGGHPRQLASPALSEHDENKPVPPPRPGMLIPAPAVVPPVAAAAVVAPTSIDHQGQKVVPSELRHLSPAVPIDALVEDVRRRYGDKKRELRQARGITSAAVEKPIVRQVWAVVRGTARLQPRTRSGART